MRIKDSNHYRYRFRSYLLLPRYWPTWIGLGIFFIITLLPATAIDRLGCRLGNIAAKKNKKRFNIIRTNLSLCFPDRDGSEIDRMVAENFQAQFRSLLHYYFIWWRPRATLSKRIHVSGFEQIRQYQQQGKNIIILLAHSVGLEFAVAALAKEYPSNGPYKKMRNPVIDWLVANGRLRFGRAIGAKLFTREDGLRPLIRETRSGKIMIYLADEDLGERNAVFVPFFGVQKATIPVLGRLARSCDAVVLPCISCYQPDSKRYAISLLPAIDGLTGKNDEQDSRVMNETLEQLISLCPVQYLWAFRYFRTRPPGEASLYD